MSLHEQEVIDIQDQQAAKRQEMEEDKRESIRAFENLQKASEGFMKIHNGLMYNSENDYMRDKMEKLESLLSDYNEVCFDAIRMADYYYE